MTNKLHCSTGTFIGRKNGYNHKLLTEYASRIHCDGFEVMVSSQWYDILGDIARDYRGLADRCRVVHADKGIGSHIANPDADERVYLDMWRKNCRFAAEIGAQTIVVHLWGPSHSDRHAGMIYRRAGALLEAALEYGLTMAAENIVCMHGSPIKHLKKLTDTYPELAAAIDTRQAHFHNEAGRVNKCKLWRGGRVGHIHLVDYSGGSGDWEAFRGITAPGAGSVDFPAFFAHLKKCGYDGTMTIEGPTAHTETGVDPAPLNAALDYIRGLMRV